MNMMTPDPAIANLPLSDPRCNSEACNAFYAGENASQAAVSWAFQAEYAHWATWYYLAGLSLFMIVYAYHWWMERTPRFATTLSTKRSSLEAITALLRFVSYRRFSGRIADLISLPSCGSILVILGTATLAAIAMFAVRPYYRERDGYGSPPLAIRSGMMALALTPIIVALAGKFNVVTLLTGIGHEKLNTMHCYLAWICFALSVAHTVPFFVAPLRDGGLQRLNMDFYTGGISSEMVRQSFLPAYFGWRTAYLTALVQRHPTSGHAILLSYLFDPLHPEARVRAFRLLTYNRSRCVFRIDALAY